MKKSKSTKLTAIPAHEAKLNALKKEIQDKREALAAKNSALNLDKTKENLLQIFNTSLEKEIQELDILERVNKLIFRDQETVSPGTQKVILQTVIKVLTVKLQAVENAKQFVGDSDARKRYITKYFGVLGYENWINETNKFVDELDQIKAEEKQIQISEKILLVLPILNELGLTPRAEQNNLYNNERLELELVNGRCARVDLSGAIFISVGNHSSNNHYFSHMNLNERNMLSIDQNNVSIRLNLTDKDATELNTKSINQFKGALNNIRNAIYLTQ